MSKRDITASFRQVGQTLYIKDRLGTDMWVINLRRDVKSQVRGSKMPLRLQYETFHHLGMHVDALKVAMLDVKDELMRLGKGKNE